MFAPVRAVFADCHVGRRPGDEGPFLKALETARDRGARAITLLGDIFHFFIAHPKFETPAIARFLEVARGLRDSRRRGDLRGGQPGLLPARLLRRETSFGRSATRSDSAREAGSFSRPTATS